MEGISPLSQKEVRKVFRTVTETFGTEVVTGFDP
jgi:hypothetical protein